MGNFTVYMHTSPIGKRYIGITMQKTEVRWQGGNGYIKNPYFTRAIKKYKWNNFCREILYKNLTKEQAEQKEIELISIYKSNDRKFGYNISNGGNSAGTHSKETLKKMSESKKGNKYPLGTKRSEETKTKLSKSKIGKYAGKNNPKANSINQYDLNGNFIRNFEYMKQATEVFGYSNKVICKVCRGIGKTAYGFIWKYA